MDVGGRAARPVSKTWALPGELAADQPVALVGVASYLQASGQTADHAKLSNRGSPTLRRAGWQAALPPGASLRCAKVSLNASGRQANNIWSRSRMAPTS